MKPSAANLAPTSIRVPAYRGGRIIWPLMPQLSVIWNCIANGGGHGHTVLEVDHEFCRSIYIRDPEGNTVEFCHTVRDFTAEEKTHALELLMNPAPEMEKMFGAKVWQPEGDPILIPG